MNKKKTLIISKEVPSGIHLIPEYFHYLKKLWKSSLYMLSICIDLFLLMYSMRSNNNDKLNFSFKKHVIAAQN